MSWQLPSLACNLTCSQKRSAAIKRNQIICCSCVRTEHQRGFYKTPPFLASAPSDSYTCTMPDSCLLKSTGLLHRKIANFLGLTSKTTSGGAKKMWLILILLYFLQSMTRSQRSKVDIVIYWNILLIPVVFETGWKSSPFSHQRVQHTAPILHCSLNYWGSQELLSLLLPPLLAALAVVPGKCWGAGCSFKVDKSRTSRSPPTLCMPGSDPRAHLFFRLSCSFFLAGAMRRPTSRNKEASKILLRPPACPHSPAHHHSHPSTREPSLDHALNWVQQGCESQFLFTTRC